MDPIRRDHIFGQPVLDFESGIGDFGQSQVVKTLRLTLYYESTDCIVGTICIHHRDTYEIGCNSVGSYVKCKRSLPSQSDDPVIFKDTSLFINSSTYLILRRAVL